MDFEPVYMDYDYLEKYKDYTKALTKNDRNKAARLLQEGKYCDVMKYMLDKGVKLEIAGPVILYGMFSSWVLGIIYMVLKWLGIM